MENENLSYHKYALCLADVKNLGARTFTYIIPERLKGAVQIGQAVSVPFGNRKQNIAAFVTGFSDYIEQGIKAKEITKIIDKRSVFSLDYLKFLDWVSAYFCCDINTVIQAAVPMKFLNAHSAPSIKEKTEKYIVFKTKTALIQAPSKRQLEILDCLEKYKEIKLIDFEKEVKTTRASVLKLKEQGFIDIIEKAVYRNPLSVFKRAIKDDFPELSAEQQHAYEFIAQKLDKKQTEPVLLHGVTGAGKTEVYFKLIKKVLDSGRNVIFLAPETALASQLTMRLISRFNPDETAVWHSRISDGEKYDVWNKLRDNKIRIIIGVRSAVFAPLNNIGLIIIDEEHESTYKQTSPAPRYDARRAAEKLCEMHNALLLKGSATPDVCSYYRACASNNLVSLHSRFNEAGMAEVITVDMREEYHKEKRSIFSNLLIREINNTLKAGRQTVLLMNRRGFYTFIQCLSCGKVLTCPECDIPFVYHASNNTLKCRWCSHSEPLSQVCPDCGSSDISMSGAGTQRIEDIARKIFPDAKIERIDSDVLNSKTKYIDILERFQNGSIDILIGTQMIAKGLDNKNVTLAGVIDADISFSLPDYHAAERGFQLLMQTAGRAGRGSETGKVIFQTYNPSFYAILNAKEQDYLSFYNTEIKRREIYDYPPFCQIIKIAVYSKDAFCAEKCAEEVSEMLRAQIEKLKLTEYIDVKDSVKCLIPKLNSEYRYQIIIKNKMDRRGHYIINTFAKRLKPAKNIKLIIDIDPADIM